jgi:membrane protein required for colicin V production
LDAAALIVIFLAALRCAFRGFVEEFFSVAGFVVAGYSAFFLWKPLSLLIVKEWAWPNAAAIIVSALAVFVVVFLIVKLVGRMLQETVVALELGSLDGFLGFLFGAVEGLLIVFLLTLIAYNLPISKAGSLFEKSFFIELFKPFLGITNLVKHV